MPVYTEINRQFIAIRYSAAGTSGIRKELKIIKRCNFSKSYGCGCGAPASLLLRERKLLTETMKRRDRAMGEFLKFTYRRLKLTRTCEYVYNVYFYVYYV